MLSIYLHIPFCQSKCDYCDFFSVAVPHPLFDSYPALLQQHLELAARQPEWQGPVRSIYFGGGTPSLLAVTDVSSLLNNIDRAFGLAPDAEISLEANPGTLALTQLQGYRAAGVNRLSLGVQTLDDQSLQQLGRRHNRQDSLQAVSLARQAGFSNLSLDLMFALPGQTLPTLRKEILRYLELEPQHLSCYGLTAEPETPLGVAVHGGRTTLPGEELYAEAFLTLHDTLETSGYDHYEIANYARPGFSCRHNLGYWQRRPYLGLGAGAHSFSRSGWGQRYAVADDLAAYRTALNTNTNPASLLETFDRHAAMAETLYLGLRTRQGVNDTAFAARFGCGVADAFPTAVAELADRLEHQDNHWAFKPHDWLLFDQLIQAFL